MRDPDSRARELCVMRVVVEGGRGYGVCGGVGEREIETRKSFGSSPNTFSTR